MSTRHSYLVGLFAIALVAAAGAALLAAPDNSPYVVGAVFDITGPASPLGTPEKETAELVAKHINAAGGINGHPLKLIILDNGSDEAKSKTAIKKLIEAENVLAIIGPSQTGTTLVGAADVEEAKVPMVSCAAGVKIVDPVKRYIFKTAQSDVHAVAKVLDYCKAKGLRDIAVISVSNAFGDSGKAQLALQAPKAGIRIVSNESFQSSDTDMTAQLMNIRRANPKAVVCWGTNPGPAVVARNMATLRMGIPLLMSHGIANRKFIELAGDAANGVIFPAGKLLVADLLPKSDPQRNVLISYRDSFNKEVGKEADTFGGHAYDALKLVVRALEKVGPDREKIRNYIEKTDKFVGVSGVFNFSATDHNGLAKTAFVMVTIKGGAWVPVK